MALSQERCVPCKSGDGSLSNEDARALVLQVPGWALSEKTIEREYVFKDFREAMAFVNRVAELANAQDHHPDIYVFYNRVRLVLSTHKVGGLSRNDFVLAAKIDAGEAQAGSAEGGE